MSSAEPVRPSFARKRKFLCVVDNTPECHVALRFAARRAQHTGGRITLLCAAERADYQQWRGVEAIMDTEAHEEAERLLYEGAKLVNDLVGIISEVVILHGRKSECLAQVLKEDRDISILVLAAGTTKEGPGPLVSMFASGVQAIPVTIVPGNLSEKAIDELA
jgi:nucleotide-binding universal stress UspA family protein